MTQTLLFEQQKNSTYLKELKVLSQVCLFSPDSFLREHAGVLYGTCGFIAEGNLTVYMQGLDSFSF